MCMNCVSTADFLVTSGGLGAYALAKPGREALVALGVLPEADPLERDVRTVAFLRRLDLDPDEILGADVVAAADRWRPAPPVYRPSALRRVFGAMRSHRTLLATQ
jgi:hypothetical protein